MKRERTCPVEPARTRITRLMARPRFGVFTPRLMRACAGVQFNDVTRTAYRPAVRDLGTSMAPSRGYLLLLSVGALFGLAVPLSRVVVEIEQQPIGLTVWLNGIIAVLCLSITVLRGRMPVIDRRLVRFIFLWGFLGAALGEVLLFWIVQHLSASTVSILLVCEGFFVYAIVTCRTRRFSLKSLAGLTLGMIGVLLMLICHQQSSLDGHALWMLATLSIPLVYAAEDLLLAGAMPRSLDLVAGTGLAAAVGFILLLPVAWLLNDFVSLSLDPTPLTLAVLCRAVTTALGTVLLARLLREAGAVFGSLAGYTITACGILWAIVLLGETLTVWSCLALVILMAGLLLVEPQRRRRRRSRTPRTLTYP